MKIKEITPEQAARIPAYAENLESTTICRLEKRRSNKEDLESLRVELGP